MNANGGRVALVTGASRGIGRAIAMELARHGCHVVVNYLRDREAAEAVAQAIRDTGQGAITVQADVATAAGAIALVEAAMEAFGTIDILINNAGITRDGLLLRMPEDDWDAVLDTNLKGAFQCIKAVQRIMLKNRAGRIIQISSVSGTRGNAGQANYSAAKAGLIGLTKSMARELAPRHITVNAVAPGFVDTEMTRALPADAIEQAVGQIPLGRLGSAEEIATAVAFLASPEAGYITGQVLGVDGGLGM